LAATHLGRKDKDGYSTLVIRKSGKW